MCFMYAPDAIGMSPSACILAICKVAKGLAPQASVGHCRKCENSYPLKSLPGVRLPQPANQMQTSLTNLNLMMTMTTSRSMRHHRTMITAQRTSMITD